jgi:hypothetical protein
MIWLRFKRMQAVACLKEVKLTNQPAIGESFTHSPKSIDNEDKRWGASLRAVKSALNCRSTIPRIRLILLPKD